MKICILIESVRICWFQYLIENVSSSQYIVMNLLNALTHHNVRRNNFLLHFIFGYRFNLSTFEMISNFSANDRLFRNQTISSFISSQMNHLFLFTRVHWFFSLSANEAREERKNTPHTDDVTMWFYFSPRNLGNYECIRCCVLRLTKMKMKNGLLGFTWIARTFVLLYFVEWN